MKKVNNDKEKMPTTKVASSIISKIKDIISVIFFLGFVFLILVLLFILTKTGKKNWEIEKSVMKPELHENIDVDVNKSYFNLIHFLKANIQDFKGGIKSFKNSFFRDYGIEVQEMQHTLPNEGINYLLLICRNRY